MMNTEQDFSGIERLLTDAGVCKSPNDKEIHQLLFYLFVAVNTYRLMTLSDRNRAGWWYRKFFKNNFPLSGFFKERKRRREKEKSPLHPSYKKESGVEEKGIETSLSPEQNFDGLDEGQMAFWKECSKYIGPKYSEDLVKAFFYYYAQRMRKNGKMAWENEDKWTLHLRLAGWKKRSFAKNDEAAEIRLAKAKAGKQQTAKVNEQQVAIARERMMEQERLEREREESKKKAVSREEWLAMKAAQEE